jgi:type IV pilus assembly protein PilP
MRPSSVHKLILGIGLLVFIVGGCAKEEESWTPPGPAVVRKKVAPKKVATRMPIPVEAEKPVTAEAEKKADEAQPSPAEPAASVKEPAAPGESTKELATLYDPTGKPDPFVPPSSRLQPSETFKKSARKHRLPLTPLQKVDLSQLKLVGIIVSPTGNKALVEEPSGKGYVIVRGTYVGPNFGRVKQILPDRVIVEEEVEDFFSGEMRLQTSELILQKKLGEI